MIVSIVLVVELKRAHGPRLGDGTVNPPDEDAPRIEDERRAA